MLVVALALLIVTLAGTAQTRDIVNPKIELARHGQGRQQTAGPVIDYMAHNRGNIQLSVANNGTFGTLGSTIMDPITGQAIQACAYPKNSDLVYLWVAAIWIGAVVGRDTLVSVGNEDFYVTTEFWPVEYDAEDWLTPQGFKLQSIDINSPYFSPQARSEEDIICEYADTLDDPAIISSDNTDNRPHKPLGIKVTQRSMAWSYSYANDFVLFDYQIESLNESTLKDVYIGIYADGDVWHTSRNNESGWNDDIVGFYPTHPAPEGCGFIDTINVAYHADNDGDPEGGTWNEKSVRSAVGARVVRTPAEEPTYSFNWWIINYGDPTSDFGPRQIGTEEDPYRYFGARMGTPLGDRNKYYMLRHEEFDYDLLFTALDHSSEGWLRPPSDAEDFAEGYDTRYMLSFGPFDINPGQKLPVSFAWLGGEDLHRDPTAFERLFDAKNPQVFYDNLNFDKLAINSRWASWVYDNPGVDTDGDGYFGKFRVCVLESVLVDSTKSPADSTWQPTRSDTTWSEGDGIPDFRGAGPPVAPKLRVIPNNGRLTVRWNGFYSETVPDIFLNDIDFEGYRVYIARDNRPNAFSLVASFDREDYSRYVFRQVTAIFGEWVLEDIPFSLEELREEYGDPDFDPLLYTRSQPFVFDGQRYFFEAQDYNVSDLRSSAGIHKVYPDADDPGTNPDLWNDADLVFDYNEPLPMYYEYELHIEDLLASVPYHVAVTAFDFGSPVSGLPPLETDPTNNTIVEYPQWSADSVASRDLDVYVYPNPYRADGGYRSLGFEGRSDSDRHDDRVRAIHFANLPYRCTITIYSLDGDLVKVIEHDKAPGDPQSAHDSWNLITRNTQTVVSGLYYYVVESDERTQIGKFAIIR